MSKPGGRATEDVVLYADPLNEKGIRSVYGKADIVLCSQGERGCSPDAFKGDTKVFDFPGEYSVQGINVFGIDDSREKEINTVFSFESEDIHVVHLGRARAEFEEKQLDSLGDVDILCVPVGGNGFMPAKEAAEIVRKIEPKIVIPMMYNIAGVPYALDEVKKFLSEMGSDASTPVDKFVCRKKDLPEKGITVVLLESQR
jgi:L-ascorbate metabolism protein UlaG (beta-lactamase superfamily)